MAEPLVTQYGPDVPKAIARMVAAVHKRFPVDAFLHDALTGYDALALMPRGKHIARALQRHLPQDYAQALPILLASAERPHGRDPGLSLGSFLYLPHTAFVAEFGLGHFELSMQAQHALTQRFTAEFSIRPFLQKHPEATLAQLMEWTRDPSEHVRRLVSEGTRPRLPWASRLPAFQRDPTPVLALLERLKDDPELYVRRSVANNLNDIGKDHPALLANTAKAWLRKATPERRWIVQHALRSAVKRGEAGALAALGFGGAADVAICQHSITPQRAVIGGTLAVAFDVTNSTAQPQRVLVDFAVHYVKANGQARAKVFKLKTLDLAAHETQRVGKQISLAEMTTRKHYPGVHQVEAILNGRAQPLGSFKLAAR
ncbi:DNA alkylation repair protein [Rhodoferax saidenbachensis]|uniref:DNA alkylation repair protein n=1 Tax=Rhodoferax saidenbachensis TaxID=1484693 RepID=A0A1P8KC86_9BURK|nr:DNA alkylation repair protein [Rhodoferax saidenbachensis]APW43599.1 DNA alkylation repair protein [Rhodoferax saidenbachensis]